MVNATAKPKAKSKQVHHYLGLHSLFFMFSNFYINIVAIFFSVLAFIFYVNSTSHLVVSSVLITSVLLGLGYYFSQYLAFYFIEEKAKHRARFTIGNRPQVFNKGLVSAFLFLGKNFLAIILNIVGLFIILWSSLVLMNNTLYYWAIIPVITILVLLTFLSSATFIVHKNIKENLTYTFKAFFKFNVKNSASYVLNLILLVLSLLFLYFLNFSFNNVLESKVLLIVFSLIFIYVYFNSLLITIQPQIDRELGDN